MTTKEQERLSTVEQGLTLLASCLVIAKREDGSEYRMLREDCPMHDALMHVVRECHRGELPNDWRYDTIYGLCHGLLDYSQPDPEAWGVDEFEEVLPDIAESLADCYTSTLLHWLADKPDRCTFDDTDLPDAYGHKGIDGLARIRQIEEIELMGQELINQLSAMAGA